MEIYQGDPKGFLSGDTLARQTPNHVFRVVQYADGRYRMFIAQEGMGPLNHLACVDIPDNTALSQACAKHQLVSKVVDRLKYLEDRFGDCDLVQG